MIIQEVLSYLEAFAPAHYAEDFDNVGLLVGNAKEKLKGVLVTLDTTEAVVAEAIENNCNLIVSFHPILFKGLKKITGKTYVERTVMMAIKHNIAIYAIHTALDNSWQGVNHIMCQKLQLQKTSVLIPQKNTIKQLTTYVPKNNAESVRNALFKVGAGAIGNYNNCSFNVLGTGTFKGNEASNPVKGKKGKLHFEEEMQLTLIFAAHLETIVQKTLIEIHPYEEVAYQISALENTNQHIGMGMLGELKKAVAATEFLEMVKQTMCTSCIRHSKLLPKKIKKVAVLGGSGSFAISAAIANKADAYITSDLKYHDFFAAENKLILADIGHYESEQFTKNEIHTILTKKITNFAVVLSKINTNPIKYF